MFETFRSLSLEQRQAWIIQWVVMGSMLFLFIPDIGIWLMLATVFSTVLGNQAYIYKTKYDQIHMHMGERYFDSFTIREKSFSQDMILALRDTPIPLELYTEATQKLVDSEDYKHTLAIVIKIRNAGKKEEPVKLKLKDKEKDPAALKSPPIAAPIEAEKPEKPKEKEKTPPIPIPNAAINPQQPQPESETHVNDTSSTAAN